MKIHRTRPGVFHAVLIKVVGTTLTLILASQIPYGFAHTDQLFKGSGVEPVHTGLVPQTRSRHIRSVRKNWLRGSGLIYPEGEHSAEEMDGPEGQLPSRHRHPVREHIVTEYPPRSRHYEPVTEHDYGDGLEHEHGTNAHELDEEFAELPYLEQSHDDSDRDYESDRESARWHSVQQRAERKKYVERERERRKKEREIAKEERKHAQEMAREHRKWIREQRKEERKHERELAKAD